MLTKLQPDTHKLIAKDFDSHVNDTFYSFLTYTKHKKCANRIFTNIFIFYGTKKVASMRRLKWQ